MSHEDLPPSVDPKITRIIVWALFVVCTAFVAADLFYDKAAHTHYDFENLVGFHAAYGFLSCVGLVLAAAQMRKLVMRSEDYYDRD